MDLLGLIFPKTCVGCGRIGGYLCQNCTKKIKPVESQICPICTRASISGLTHPKCKSSLNIDGLISFFYHQPPLTNALYKLKYKFVQDFAKGLSHNLDINLLDNLKSFYMTSVPLYEKRENWRGFNQVELLAKYIAGGSGLEFRDKLLRRKRDTKTQVGLSRRQRAENVKSAFECLDKDFVKGKSIILFDDVWTSGATMRNTAVVLKRAGAKKVWGLTLARSR